MAKPGVVRKFLRFVVKYVSVFAAGLSFGVIVGMLLMVRAHTPPWLADAAIELGRQEAQKPGGRNAALVYWRTWLECDGWITELGYIHEKEVRESGVLSEEVRRVLNRESQEIRKLLEAAEYAECDFGVEHEQAITAMLPHLMWIRHSAKTLALDAYRAGLDGDSESAAERLLAVLSMSQHLKADGQQISTLVAVSLAQLAMEWTGVLLDSDLLDTEERIQLATRMRELAESDFGHRAAIETEQLQMPVNISMSSQVDSVDGVAELGLRLGKGEELAAEVDEFYAELLSALEETNPTLAIAEVSGRAGAGEFGFLAQTLDEVYVNAAVALDQTQSRLLETADVLER